MKKAIIISILVILLTNILQAQLNKGFVLKGNIEGLKHNTRLYLVLGRNVVDSTDSKRSKFEFRGKVEGEANYYFIFFDSINAENMAQSVYSNALWLMNRPLEVTGNRNEVKKLILENSPAQKDYEDWLGMTGGKGSYSWEMMPNVVRYFKERPNSMFTPYLLESMLAMFQMEYEDTAIRKVANMNAYDEICNSLSKEAKASYWGQKLAKKRKLSDLADKMADDNKIPDFKVSMSNGTISSIHALARKNKYTLLDFWASWCGPCRKAVPALKEVYAAFKEQGFEILGVSSDKNQEAWKNAIQQDQTSWLHGLDNIDIAGDNLFGFDAIPAYILIDREGRIIQTSYFSTAVAAKPRQTYADKSLSKNLRDILKSLFEGTDATF